MPIMWRWLTLYRPTATPNLSVLASAMMIAPPYAKVFPTCPSQRPQVLPGMLLCGSHTVDGSHEPTVRCRPHLSHMFTTRRTPVPARSTCPHPLAKIFGTMFGLSRYASGMPEPSSGRRYMRNASVTSWPDAAMKSSGMVRVLPATSSSGTSS